MTTVGDAVDRCLSTWLYGTYSAQLNAVKTGIDPTATEIDCSFPLVGVGQDTFVAIDDELCFVIDVDQTNQRIVVDRGARGTQPAAHTAGTDIEVNPRFPRFLVREQMRADVDSWPESLYVIQTDTPSIGQLDVTIPIPTSIGGFVPRSIVRLRRHGLYNFDARLRRTQGYEVDWSSGIISLNENISMDRTYTIDYACAFNSDALADDDNDVAEDVGLTPGMVEIMELGAAYRLLMGRGSVRLFPEAQGQSRMPQEVGGLDIPRFSAQLLALRKDRMGEEAQRLSRRSSFGGS